MDSFESVGDTLVGKHDHNKIRVVFRKQPEVVWTDANGSHTVALDERAVVGSASAAALVIADPTVSRLHAEFETREDGIWVRDLGSRNGTFVSNILVSSARVPEGVFVQMGSTTLQIRWSATPSTLELWPDNHFQGLVGQSVAMRALFARIARAASSEATVLIHGETGTGKELIARAIHDASPRAHHPFVIVDCGSLPEHLLENELFGHARGAFTGAVDARPGAIEAADGGTVFLDEIGEMQLAMQPKLLRAIESCTVRRIGETTYRKVNVRFIAATHRDLRQMVNAQAFREDLFFRLAVLRLSVPPLRERPEDIPALLDHFLRDSHGAITNPDLLQQISARPWLGNVRELRNFVEQVRAFGPGEALEATSTEPPANALESSVDRTADATRPIVPPEVTAGPPSQTFELPFREVRDQWLDWLEREYIATLLRRYDRNIPAVARNAGLDRTYVYKLIRKHGL